MPKLAEGELGFALDERRLYVGDGDENIELAKTDHKHPGGIFFSVDFSEDLSNTKINDGIFNEEAGRIEASL
jgi:hypothetical protein